mmetsp:Transcript_40780/g.85663  ORF Transcript_40780/g.85663 Transcript_40780/m.85663 type:complete len:360 (+) Transcript_40780:163-1242(+)
MASESKRTKTTFVYNGQVEVPKDVISVEFDPSVTEVPCSAFYGCTALRHLVLNEGLRIIREYAFEGCKYLERLELPASMVEIGRGAFRYCHDLREMLLNEGLETIGWGAFEYCKSLESIKLPSTIIEIRGEAFSGCSALSYVLLNNGLQKIGKEAFLGCESLKSIEVPSTVIEIGSEAFMCCRSLTELLLNEGLQMIGEDAFHQCESLQYAKFPSISMRLGSIACDRGRSDISHEIDDNLDIEVVDGEFLIDCHPLRGWRSWNSFRESLNRILRLMTYYELKEATTIFELALWKSKVSEGSNIGDANRCACRIEVPGPVKDTFMQYFPHIRLNNSDFSDSDSDADADADSSSAASSSSS